MEKRKLEVVQKELAPCSIAKRAKYFEALNKFTPKEINGFKVVKLKEILNNLNLPSSGLKVELVNRVEKFKNELMKFNSSNLSFLPPLLN
jgi:hypothetical protein